MTQSVPNKQGGVSLHVKDEKSIQVGEPVAKPSLCSDQFDPFKEFKTEPEKYAYRALNIRPQNMRTRLAEGWETIPETEFGDLILAKIPIGEHERRINKEEMKTKQRTHAAVDQFKVDAEKLGVKTFED